MRWLFVVIIVFGQFVPCRIRSVPSICYRFFFFLDTASYLHWQLFSRPFPVFFPLRRKRQLSHIHAPAHARTPFFSRPHPHSHRAGDNVLRCNVLCDVISFRMLSGTCQQCRYLLVDGGFSWYSTLLDIEIVCSCGTILFTGRVLVFREFSSTAPRQIELITWKRN